MQRPHAIQIMGSSLALLVATLVIAPSGAQAAPCDPVPTAREARPANIAQQNTGARVAAESTRANVLQETAVQHVGDEAILTPGKVRVADLLAYLQRATGKPVLFASIARFRTKAFAFDANIEVLDTIRPLTVPVVEALLASNFIRLKVVTLANGAQVIHATEDRSLDVSDLSATGVPTPTAKDDRPVLLAPGESLATIGDRIGVIVVPVKVARAHDLERLVQKLLNDRSLEVLPLGGKNAQHLLLRGRARSLETACQLLGALDKAELWPDGARMNPPDEGSAQEADRSESADQSEADRKEGSNRARGRGTRTGRGAARR